MNTARVDREVERVHEYASSIQLQVSHLQSMATRREKQIGDEVKGIQDRLLTTEKKTDAIQKQKADQQKVKEGMDDLRTFFTKQIDTTELRNDVSSLTQEMKGVQKKKVNQEELVRVSQKVTELTSEVRSNLTQLESSMRSA